MQRCPTALVGLVMTMLFLTACLAPVRYDVEVDVASDGSYALRYEGTVAHVPLRMLLLEGESELALREEVEAVAAQLSDSPDVLRVLYVGGGVFRVVGAMMVGATEMESLFGVVTVTRETDGLVFQTEGLGSEAWETYEALELEHEGNVVVRSEAIVRYSNGDGGPTEFTWNAEALRRSGILFRAYIPTDAENRCFRDPTADCFLALALEELDTDATGSARFVERIELTMFSHYLELGDFVSAGAVLRDMEVDLARRLAERLAMAQLEVGDAQGARTTALAFGNPEMVLSVAEGLVGAGEVGAAKLLVTEAHSVESILRGEAFAVVAMTQFSAGDGAGARQTIEEALGSLRDSAFRGPSMGQVFAPYAAVLAAMGHEREAQALVDEVAATGENQVPVVVAAKAGRAQSFLSSARYAEALDVAREVEDEEVRDQLLLELITLALQREEVGVAVMAVEALLDPPAWHVAPVAMAQAERGDLDAALKTLSYAQEGPFKQAQEAIVLAVVGRFDEALAMTDTFDWRAQEAALSAIASAQVDAGDYPGAVRTIGRLTSASSSFLDRLVVELVDAGAVDDAYAMIATLEAADPGFEPFARGMSDTLIETQALAGDIEGAWRSVAVLNPEGSGSYEIVKAQLANGDVQGAVASTERMPARNFTYWWALRDIAIAHAEAGNVAEALRTIELLEDVKVESLSSIGTYFDAIDGVAWRLVRAGDHDRARALVDHAVLIAYSVRVQGLEHRLAALSTTMRRIASVR